MKKLLYFIGVFSFSVWIWLYYFFFMSNWTSANPDYICVKSVVNQPCITTHCDSWTADWKRTCHWTKATQVAYYLVRTTCESWYTQVSNWWNVWLASWRQWWDYISDSNTCTVQQVDNVPPIWTAISQ